jgi:creatinine amidohydrolase
MANGGGFLLAEMTSAQVRAAVAAGRATIVLPFGAVEQHGPHLPLDTDSVLGDQLGALLARRLAALCAPILRIGCSAHHLSFAGTLSLRPETLRMIVLDVVDSLAQHGFRRIVLLPTHGGGTNSRSLRRPSSHGVAA